ncbi:MAG TPA: AMP-binding protein [Acidimicrobiales bacterium]|nr:AMP-binding protein [Acidimicrobiales bacterium]
MNLASLVLGHDARAPAVHDGRRSSSWGELRARAAGVVGALGEAGVAPGDHVAIVWPNSCAFVACYLGVVAAGAVAVPLNPASPGPELEAELESVRPSLVLSATDCGPVLSGLGCLDGVAVMDDLPPASPDPLEPLDRGDGDPAVLLFTSGTAGPARPAVLSHGNLRANLHQMLSLPGDLSRPGDVAFTAVPLFHIFGLNVALGLCLATGAALAVEDHFDPVSSWSLVSELAVTTLVGVPAMFGSWAERASAGELAPAGGVRLAVCGAASLAPETAHFFEEHTGITLWSGYGLTEASPVVSTTVGTGRNVAGSVGRPLPGVELRLVDEAGADVLHGDPGEIWVRGANVFGGYFEDPESSAEVLTGDGWLRTGDIGVLGDDGDLFVVDRRKDLIIVSGFNVFPGEVEQVLRTVPGVRDVVVVGRPDPVAGESVEAVVVAAAGDPVPTEEQLRQACAASLARYKCPNTVRFVDQLPRGLVGKALRRAVREP